MKQIKTVTCPIYETELFDKKVNRLLVDGWELKKRTIVSAKGEPNEVGSSTNIQMLYAEFERYKPPFPEEITL